MFVVGLAMAGCSTSRQAEKDGWAMLLAGDYEGARAHYESALAEDPSNPYMNLNLGYAYDGLGDEQMAAKHYQVAMSTGKDAGVREVMEDGNVAPRETTVAKVAEENLADLGS
jgi:Tfp pilus assembly protein PilF